MVYLMQNHILDDENLVFTFFSFRLERLDVWIEFIYKLMIFYDMPLILINCNDAWYIDRETRHVYFLLKYVNDYT